MLREVHPGGPGGSTIGHQKRKRTLAVTAAMLVLGAGAAEAAVPQGRPLDAIGKSAGDLIPRVVPERPEQAEIPPGYSHRRLHLKLVEGSDVRLRGAGFASPDSDQLSGLREVLRDHPGVDAERLFHRPRRALERQQARIERESEREQADLSLYYRLRLAPDTHAKALIDRLNGLTIVEIAYAEPKPAPPPNHAGPTPDFTELQAYSDAAPQGIGVDFARTSGGGTGSNVRIIDVEYSWNTDHEDLGKARAPGAVVSNGTPSDPFSDDNHGTAVLGELVGDDNAFGVTGLAHGATVGMTNAHNTADGYDLADSIEIAHAALDDGDVILIEQQISGRNSGAYVPVEWVQAYYDAIVSATSDGIIVVEAAGNGSEDLDASEYGNPFPGGRADSGAIIVGAANNFGCTSPAHGRSWFSTFGSRVDLHAFGECVVTTGYGNLQSDPSPDFLYTSTFSGTSSASPIVTGTAAILSSVAQAQGDADGLTSAQARALLAVGATPQQTVAGAFAGNIGPMPDLADALIAYLPVADAGGPYATPEGSALTLSADSSSDPQGQSLSYAWDLDDDGRFDDANGAGAQFAAVGRDGGNTVRVRVTDSAGASDTDEATAAVTNVPPRIASLPSGLPQDENASVTVRGEVTDPGWLDPLSATIDWGDGTVGPASGALESAPPDATLSFSAGHDYGDKGTYEIQVCPADDDGVGTCASVAVDGDPPQTRITKKPKRKSTNRRAKIKFTSDEAGSTFECKLDRKPYRACTSPLKVRVDEGKHKFQVRAVDAAGNVDPSAAKDTFKVVG